LGLALAAGQCEPQGSLLAPPSWLLRGSKLKTNSCEATEARQLHGSCRLWENAAGAGETATGPWQPFDSKQKCSVTFIMKEKEISQKYGSKKVIWSVAKQGVCQEG